MKRGLACHGHIVEHVAFLETQRGDDRQDTFDKAAPAWAIGSEAAFSPQDTLTENPFREVVRGLDPFEGNEGSEGGLQGQNLATSSRDETGRARGSLLEPSDDMHSQRFHELFELRPRQCAVAHTMPQMEHRVGEQLQRFADRGFFRTVVLKADELAQQMGPAKLSSQDVDPRVGASAIRDQDPGEHRAEHLLGDLGAAGLANEEDRHRRGDCAP